MLLLTGIILGAVIYIVLLKNRLSDAQLKITKLKIETESTLANKQLNNSKESKSHNASTAKVRYLSGISHELRTPLNVIMGYAQLLEKQALTDDPNKGKYTLMRHNCEHLSHLIEGVLEFSAIEAGKLKVQFETIDLHDLIHQITVMFNHQATQKDLKFISNIDKKLPKTVKTDYKRLQQILMNLLTNAIKFTESGQVEFNISYRNQVATFSIKDSGCGIESRDMALIFEPFERIEQPNKPIKGTGLGLPITRLLVDLLGGELKVVSQINQGSEFTVKMMLSPLSHSINILDEVEKVGHKQIGRTGHSQNALHNILVIDDEKSHRDLLLEILTPYQFKVRTAENAMVAKTLLKEHFFSLAIIDVSMPDINGWQLAKWIKANAVNTKIMMLSANPRDVETSTEKHHDTYLTKPIKIKQLMTDIKQLLVLDWQDNNPTTLTTVAACEVNLANEHKNALINMLEIGHINGIETYLTKLAEQKVITQQQYNQLLQPLKGMNLNNFKRMIKSEC